METAICFSRTRLTRVDLVARHVPKQPRPWPFGSWSLRPRTRQKHELTIKKRFATTRYNRLAATLMTTQPDQWSQAIHLHQGFPHGLNRFARDGDALLILFSYAFASLVTAKSAFVKALVNQVFATFTPTHASVYLAVVDRIPASTAFKQAVYGAATDSTIRDDTCEGWSMILVNKHSIKDTSQPSKLHNDAAVPHISFTATDSKNGPLTVKLPLANTLFENGQHNTLLHTEWQQPFPETQSPETRKLQLDFDSSLRSLSVNLDLDIDAAEGAVTVPHSRLTPVRRIEESLGNVIKALSPAIYRPPGSVRDAETEQAELLSASAELQANLMSGDGPTKAGQIFAVVAPPKVFKLMNILWNERSPKAHAAPKKPQMPTASLLRQDILRYMSMGLKIFKVVGGGGEWGSRASLITLQPDALFQENIEVDFDTISLDADAFKQHLQSSSMAPEGHFIQFFAAASPICSPNPESENVAIRMGCRSSDTFDSTIATDSHHQLFPGFFGGISTQGIGVTFDGSDTLFKGRQGGQNHTVSIDIPGASLMWQLSPVRSDSRISKTDSDVSLGQWLVRKLDRATNDDDIPRQSAKSRP